MTRNIFVFSGGGSRGAAQIGMLRALLGAGIRPDVVIGSSVGAINACSLAYDPTPERVEQIADRWMAMRARDITGSRATVPGNLVRLRPYLFSSERLRDLVASWIPATRLEDLPVTAVVATTNLNTGQAHHHTTGSLGDLLAASAAIPAVFPPVLLDSGDGRAPHVDAGISENMPMSAAAAIAEPGDRVFALDVTKPPAERSLRSPLDVLIGSLAISIHHRSSAVLDPGVQVVSCVLDRSFYCGTMLDFTHTGTLFRLGEQAVVDALVHADVAA
ncbi:patatin-like phospholipase family protein [Nocardioides sp. J2M5]|uniref:patatin-like phospholipase family protein n=1 Tax=Nocardioides palaemonis TaxID=2829810 RepID=UPI001BABA3F3|nr:patatin-like phospholipase family protein [Nocardioides palaemonis]MBS2939250.1 patatin-like phospholipase family protein [Nocardioides palaemonis]